MHAFAFTVNAFSHSPDLADKDEGLVGLGSTMVIKQSAQHHCMVVASCLKRCTSLGKFL